MQSYRNPCRGNPGCPRALLGIVALFCIFGATARAAGGGVSLIDPQDGYFDVSKFLDTSYGFIPIVVPITEPAVGFGATAALVFIDRKPQPEGDKHPQRPNIFAAGGLLTENGTNGLFGGHLGTWMDGRMKSLVALADLDARLTFHGLGEEAGADEARVKYRVQATGGAAGLDYRLSRTPLWFGLRYLLAGTEVGLDADEGDLPPPLQLDNDLRIAGLTPSITWDSRDNFFTPRRGAHVSLSVPLYRDFLGSDRDFETASLAAIYYHPLGERWFLGARATARTSSDGTPFYLRPFVSLRGVEALSYQGEQSFETEVELRWQFHPRWSALGFAGAGRAQSSIEGRDFSRDVASGGVGFRYLAARSYGLHMGLDVGFGPDSPVLYVVFGSAWLRP